MALTKISTGGVKDDAASQAKIADEAIDEARLQISNAGTNGQFLSKQSGNTGGLTWADGASEGTEVKSTGESGTTKFLRVDGDGTCSWQVPPDTNTQVGGATGVDFDDNVKSRFGTGNDLEIYHDGTKSYIKNTTGDLILHSSRVLIKNAINNEVGFVFTEDGSAELHHNDSKKLETTSTGIDVTGQINVNGSPLSAAPEITATADGAIAANKPVVITAAGKIAEVKNTTISASTGSNYDIPHRSGYTPNGRKCVWISTTKFVLLWRADNDNDRLWGAVGEVNGTTISYNGSATAIGDYAHDGITSPRQVDAAYDSSSNAVVVTYCRTSRRVIKGLTVSGSTISISSTEYDQNISTDAVAIECDNKGGFIFVYRVGNAYSAIGGTVSNTGAIATSGAYGTTIASDSGGDAAIAYDSDSDKFVTLRWTQSPASFKTTVLTRSGTSVTVGTPTQSVTNVENQAVYNWIYDPTNKHFLTVYNYSSASHMYYATLTMNSAKTALVAGSGAAIYTINKADNMQQMGHDKASAKTAIVFAAGSSTTYMEVTCNANGGTCSINASDATIASHKEENGIVVSCSGDGKIFTGVDKSDNSDINTRIKQVQVVTSNLRAKNFIGFSTAAISDTASGTVAVTGNTTTQSSLTPAETYYVQEAGTLSTTADDPSVVAGIAIASDKLLIKG